MQIDKGPLKCCEVLAGDNRYKRTPNLGQHFNTHQLQQRNPNVQSFIVALYPKVTPILILMISN